MKERENIFAPALAVEPAHLPRLHPLRRFPKRRSELILDPTAPPPEAVKKKTLIFQFFCRGSEGPLGVQAHAPLSPSSWRMVRAGGLSL